MRREREATEKTREHAHLLEVSVDALLVELLAELELDGVRVQRGRGLEHHLVAILCELLRDHTSVEHIKYSYMKTCVGCNSAYRAVN